MLAINYNKHTKQSCKMINIISKYYNSNLCYCTKSYIFILLIFNFKYTLNKNRTHLNKDKLTMHIQCVRSRTIIFNGLCTRNFIIKRQEYFQTTNNHKKTGQYKLLNRKKQKVVNRRIYRPFLTANCFDKKH